MARLRLPALVLSLALALAACGVTGGSGGSSDAPARDEAPEAEPLSPVDEEMLDLLVDTYTSLGFTEDEAECLGRNLLASGALEEGEMPDVTALMDVFNECDLSIGRMNEVLGSSGAETFADGARIGMVASLEAQGLSTEQAECVADAYLDEHGGDSPEDFDLSPDALTPFLERCDVGPEDFGN